MVNGQHARLTPKHWFDVWSLAEIAQHPDKWESLCDGCGKCCVFPVHGGPYYCPLFDPSACKCSDYENRLNVIAVCKTVTPENIFELAVPETCGYLRVAKGLPIPPWHPLRTGRPIPDEHKVSGMKTLLTPKEAEERGVAYHG